MAIVATYKLGKSIVHIDDSCIKYVGEEQVKPVLKRIARICYEDAINAQLKREKQEKEHSK